MKGTAKHTALLVILLLMVSLPALISGEKNAKVDKLFAQWDKPDSPGCSLAVIENGKIVYERGYGLANLEHNIPITPDTVFYIGSLSKQFVAMCIVLLAKQGKLSLDDNIRTYIPEIPEYSAPITIRHLILHTSGLRDYLTLEDLAGIPLGFNHKNDVLELISRQNELNFSPGEEYLYSNSGYFLLGVIVERASGKSLREFADTHIFKSLGMKNSHFHDDYTMLIKNRASGYYPEEKEKYKNFISTFDCVGSGGLYTSVRDLYLWDQNFSHKKIGGKEVIDLMHTTGTLNSGKKIDYAFALLLSSYKGLKTVSHGGALGGYRSAMVRFPEQNFSVICLANLSSFNPTKLCYEVADIYLSPKFKEEEKPGKKATFISLPKKKLQEKVGTYIDPKKGTLRKISLRGNSLILEVSGDTYQLEAMSETEFRTMDAPTEAVVTFEKQEGKPIVLHILQEGESPETYETCVLAPPAPDELKEYSGDFSSQELQVTYTLSLKDGKLYFTHKNAPETPLQPAIKDMFTVRGLQVRFIRDEEEKISGFSLDAGRVRNIKFFKK